MIYVVDHARSVAWEAAKDHRISEVTARLKDDAYRFGLSFVITQDADSFRRLNPEFARYKIVQTFDEFKGGDRDA